MTEETYAKLDQYIRLIPTLGKVKAAKQAGVSTATIYRHRQASESFAAEEALAYSERVDKIEAELERIALGEEDGSSVQVNAANLILKANRSKYHNTTTTQLVGAGGGAIQVEQKVDQQSVNEAIKQLQAQMLALPPAENTEDVSS